MTEELDLSYDAMEQKSMCSMTIQATLSDGTTINVAISPPSTQSSAVTASTTLTHTSLHFHINTTLPNHISPSHESSHSPKVSSSPTSTLSENPLKPISTELPLVELSKPRKMAASLPEDVVAIDTGKKSLLFYVYADKSGNNQLSYLESPNEYGTGNFVVKKIKAARNPFDNDEDEVISISSNNKQVAAVTWVGPQGIEIRVYYVAKEKNRLREVCKTGDEPWYVGSLSVKGNPYTVSAGTSISASVHYYEQKKTYNLRVFASRDGVDGTNSNDIPQISSFKFMKDEGESASWQSNFITDAVAKY